MNYKLFFLILLCINTILFCRAEQVQWQEVPGVKAFGEKVIIDTNTPLTTEFRRKDFWKVEPGADFVLSVEVDSKLTNGEIAVDLHAYSGYDGTTESIRRMKKISVIQAGTIGEAMPSGRRTMRCVLTVPSDVTALQARIAVKEFNGRVTLDKMTLEQGDDTIAIPWINTLPSLDGKWNDDFCHNALSLHDFLLYPIRDNRLDDEQTEGCVAMSNTHLYGTFLLKQKAGLPWIGQERPRDDSQMWRDDSIEFFITHVGGQKPIYLFILNTYGGIYDSMNDGTTWNSGIQTAVSRNSDGTAVIQFMLPLKDLGYVPGTDDNIIPPVWRFNVRRNHAKCAVRVTERQSTLAPITETHDFSHYLKIRRMRGRLPMAYSTRLNTLAGFVTREKQVRFWTPKTPMFHELLSKDKPALAGDGPIFWYHPFDPAMILFALQYGLPWNREQFGEIFVKNRMHVFGVYDIMADWAESATTKPGCGAVLHGPIWVRDWAMNHSLEARKEFIATLRKSITDRPGKFWAVTLGDEIIIRLRNIYIRRANDQNYIKNNPEFREMMETVKRDYGFGKYGIPTQAEGNPFGLVALSRYLCDVAVSMQHEVKKMLAEHEKETGEKILLLVQDPMGYTPDEYLSRLAKDGDLMTLQNGPVHHPHRQQIAFLTQLCRDLGSPRPVWPCVHVESYLGCYSPEETYTAISEAIRGGATGIHLFNKDTRGLVAKSGGTFLDYYGHRPRWDATLEAATTLHGMNALDFPKPSVGLFYSSDTQFSEPAYDVIPPEMAFNLAGPGAGAYLRIMDDIQLEDGDAKLNDWKVILLPDAQIERENVSRKFMEYVEQGGVLICSDPLVFSNGIDGSDTSRLRETLFGALTIAKNHAGSIQLVEGEPLFDGLTLRNLPLFSSEHHLEPMDGTRIIGRFTDGAPAIVLKEYPNGGKTILFAVSFKNIEPLQNHAEWHQFFRHILDKHGIPTNLPIWNFSLPLPEKYRSPKPQLPERQCLTGNHFFWFDNVPQKLGNVNLPGANYTLGIAPDSDPSGKREFAFSAGNLTNRLTNLQLPDIFNADNRALIKAGTLHLGLFCDVWKKTDAFDIRFRFPKAVTVEQIRIVFANTLPDYQVSCDGGKTFTTGKGGKSSPLSDEAIGAYSANTKVTDVNSVMLGCKADVGESVLEIPPQKTSEVILKFAARPEGERMILSEIELWGKDK
ncbi:MAG: hypothetical protein J6X55_15695 [Victivallales bacterium]|nr:hypothetical protein [Victivallales bacterium]